MRKNQGWLIFLLIIGLPTFFFSGTALYKLYNYSHLDAKTQAEKIEWSVIKEEPWSILNLVGWGEERYILKVAFEFESEGVFYKKEAYDDSFRFRNEWAAQQEIAQEQNKKHFVWFQSSNPRHANLQKAFPVKECLSAIVLLGIFIYFVCLGFSAVRR
ncbi:MULTISPECIES: hypothetical protein [Parachlamydia]|jgi:hypothetical protein|uniref:DUF3592 domain-containing protein n=2 Tax=Parachlamydia acanthamoebae TaxID=83552 RepID=F8KW41_PARAV|nr:hypothetical protein [Parachlamydia acanthamoebae]EFB40369.1 hypothetical protein pah_c207o070 [Parachlamydia acanthamoebae str. Hall's coccus]KIA76110.1 hypothetical protein DB43_AU00170 [Parachlamydia acanthamoebae]CCB85441.1 putative uncharacterized protein [Parachlamydia acanthamoebae UV-7]